ncbi:MAG: [Fe-Fe] hydrogenase large subunit C-terminal domain-containing protein [Victivallaceae bacterium]|nr:[Fe-Fe] hydrogenase large subunit C-terminal domain-containing protein [Victivallaceae bacterium]
MNADFPIYTTPNECQDCYKCVRHCSCKAIRIVNARAAVIPELCVSCGECVRVCPAHAKKIRSDLARAQFLLSEGKKLYASIAPSWIGCFKGVSLGALAAGLKRLGFAGVGETALGAQIVSAETGRFLQTAPPGVYISSACPSAVDFIAKYHPEWLSAIVPVTSPVIAHSRLLHQKYGNDAKVVFIGPCAAKKLEADRKPGDLALALTFPVLTDWLESAHVDLGALESEPVVPVPAEEGRCYSLEGGMNDTLRDVSGDTRYIAVSGISELTRLLGRVNADDIRRGGGKLFIEALACPGGCVNGPAMPHGSSSIDVVMNTVAVGSTRSSLGREVTIDASELHYSRPVVPSTITESDIRAALASVGKFSVADELNCGGCGYNTCREFARAKLDGKAESSMCLSYLRKISEKTSTALIKYIPVGVVLVNSELRVTECNRHFAELCGEETLRTYDACGNLNGAILSTLVDFTDLVESVMANGGELERFNQTSGDRIFNISVFSITPGQTAGAVVQDVTRSELQREQVAEKAREVIRKNVMTVQKIARCLGEHMADTEILLNEVAGAYSKPAENNPEQDK